MIIPMLCVTIFVILVVWFLLPRVARLMIHTPTAISIFVCLSMVQLMAVFICMRCTLCGHFLQVALTLILVVGDAISTSQEAVQNQNEPQLRDENAHNDKSVHGVLNPTYQAGLRRDAVQPDIEAERKKRDEIEAGKSYCSRRFGGATCDDKSAQIYARFDKNDWRIQPAEFYRFHDAEVNTFGYF